MLHKKRNTILHVFVRFAVYDENNKKVRSPRKIDKVGFVPVPPFINIRENVDAAVYWAPAGKKPHLYIFKGWTNIDS